jgi:hypothetical protein
MVIAVFSSSGLLEKSPADLEKKLATADLFQFQNIGQNHEIDYIYFNS